MKATVDIRSKVTLQDDDHVERMLHEVPYSDLVDKLRNKDKDVHLVYAEYQGSLVIPLENGDIIRVYLH